MYHVIDDLIPTVYQDDLDRTLNEPTFPYYFTSTINQNYKSKDYLDKKVTDAPGWTHLVYNPETQTEWSDLFFKIKPMLFFLERRMNISVNEILRIRIRRTTQFPGHTLDNYNPPHIDLKDHPVDYYSMVYYVDETDGDTVLFKNVWNSDVDSVMYEQGDVLARVPPKKGRAVFFKGLIFHSGNCPVNFVKRTIINFDFTLNTK